MSALLPCVAALALIGSAQRSSAGGEAPPSLRETAATIETTEGGTRWTLARDGADRILVDDTGAMIRFSPHRPLADGAWRWASADGALLDGGLGSYRLREADGRTVKFDGAHPVGTDSADAAARRHRPVRCPADERCDAAASPAPDAFADGPTIPGASTLDVRPSHCGSHFAEPGVVIRGSAIERGLEGVGPHAAQRPTSRSFPVVDFVGRGELVVVRSRDLASPSYAEPGRRALYERLIRDGREIEALLLDPLARDGVVAVTAERGDPGIARVEALPGRTVSLQIVVRHGIASPAQILQIERARTELARRHGIALRVVEIP